MSREEMCSMLDGNAAGGLLREVFAFEATAAQITCAGCARMMPMGELRLYAIELGAILRCPSCDEAVVRIGCTPRGLCLDLRRAATIVTVSAGIRPESEVCIRDHGYAEVSRLSMREIIASLAKRTATIASAS
jgi:Family of unknown function (DUF6510)